MSWVRQARFIASIRRTLLSALFVLLGASLIAFAEATWANQEAVLLQSTTSTKNSGLLGYLLPKFKATSGYDVQVVAVGTGQALTNARNGDADVLLVHSKADEERFVADGFGVARFDLMYNDFVLVGPQNDPAGIGGAEDIVRALAKVAEQGGVFLSRGDDSGTHKKELSLWRASAVEPRKSSGTWYRETGAGMGTTLNIAVGMGAYTLTDRGTWLAFGNKQDFAIHVEGDKRLFNQYGIILVEPKRHPHVNQAGGQALINWLLSSSGQAAIGAYKIGGMPLFVPNGKHD